jgi:ribonuclease E
MFTLADEVASQMTSPTLWGPAGADTGGDEGRRGRGRRGGRGRGGRGDRSGAGNREGGNAEGSAEREPGQQQPLLGAPLADNSLENIDLNLPNRQVTQRSDGAGDQPPASSAQDERDDNRPTRRGRSSAQTRSPRGADDATPGRGSREPLPNAGGAVQQALSASAAEATEASAHPLDRDETHTHGFLDTVPPEPESASSALAPQPAWGSTADTRLLEPSAPNGNPIYRRYEDAAPMPKPLPRWDETPAEALESASEPEASLGFTHAAPAVGSPPVAAFASSPVPQAQVALGSGLGVDLSALQTLSNGIFVLPVEQLQSQLSSAGLEWVNSDTDKIRATQELMAREAPPVHTPRERKPLELSHTGPLIMVETRRDLRQVKLPFEVSA